VSVSSTVTVVGKVGLLCVIVFIGFTVFRRTSAGAQLSEAWSMHQCKHRLQEDLDVLLVEKSPEVMSCVGPAAMATCQVKTVEWFAPCRSPKPNVLKTAPLRSWDCTRRHVPEGHAGWVLYALVQGRPLNETERGLFEEFTARNPRMFDEADNLASWLKARQALLDP